MFKTYEFIFAGMPSSMYGLMVCDFAGKNHSDNAFGNKAKIVETRIPGRVRPLHHGVDYNSDPLTFKLIFGADHELDRWDLQEVSYWLTGHQQYQWLQIEQPDLAHIEYRCLITDLTPISIGWLPYAFEATVTCDCPYAYGFEFEKTMSFSDGDELYVFNESTAHECCYPKLKITPHGDCVSITNMNDKNYNGNANEFSLTGIPSGSTVFIDNENGIIRDETFGTNLYDGFNDTFFRLVPGDNNLKMTGSGTMTISGRFYYNVGA